LSVKIRLRRGGMKKRPYYRIVAADSRMPRDGRFLENLGYYHPIEVPPRIEVNNDRSIYWLSQGAETSDSARKILRKAGVLKNWHELRMERQKNLGLLLPPSESEKDEPTAQ
jgi:small subunit ribosomal protein S16